MAVTMGNAGVVANGASAVSTTRQWSVDYLEDDKPYASSNTSAGTGRKTGILDWTGQYAAYGANPAVFPGDNFVFTGASDTSIGVNGTAIVERSQILWNHEENDYVQHIVQFAGNGDLTLTGTDTDDAIPCPAVSGSLGITYSSDGLSYTSLTDIRKALLDFRMMYGKPPGQLGNRPYSSSAAPGKVRRKRSRLDFAGWVDCYVNSYLYTVDPNLLPTIQTAYTWRFYTTDTLYWQLKWGRVTKIEDYGANVEDMDLLHLRIHFAMNVSDCSNLGSVLSPGSVQEWPF